MDDRWHSGEATGDRRRQRMAAVGAATGVIQGGNTRLHGGHGTNVRDRRTDEESGKRRRRDEDEDAEFSDGGDSESGGDNEDTDWRERGRRARKQQKQRVGRERREAMDGCGT